jgi:eukaryotic translation initiation factor 2C
MAALLPFLQGSQNETPLAQLAVLDAVLRHAPSLVFRTLAQSFYTSDLKANISDGVQLWPGYHQSLQPTKGRILLNIDCSATAFKLPGNIIVVAEAILGRPLQNTGNDISKLERNLIGYRIVVLHRGRVQRSHRVRSVTQTSAKTTMFPQNNSGDPLSVADYFELKYEPLKYPEYRIFRV